MDSFKTWFGEFVKTIEDVPTAEQWAVIKARFDLMESEALAIPRKGESILPKPSVSKRIIDMIKREISSGQFDEIMRSRYGGRVQTRRA